MSLTTPVSAGSLKKGSLVMIKDHACKVTAYSTAKTGKHGAAKAMITGVDIFDNSKHEITYSTGENVDTPVTTRKEYTLIDIDNDDGFVTLLDENGNTKEDLKLPVDKELADQIKQKLEAAQKEGFEVIVTVLGALNREQIMAVRESKTN